jgi:hypothetical protein
MGIFYGVSLRKYVTIAVTLLIVALLACGVMGTVSAQVSVVSSGGSFAATGPGGSFVGTGMPYYGNNYYSGGYYQDQMNCYQDSFGNMICRRVPPNVYGYPGGAVYRNPGTVVIQGGAYY